MSRKKLDLNIEIVQATEPFTGPDINITGDFNTENPMFEELASHLAELNRLNQISPESQLDLLEKLEILCKRARVHCGYNEAYWLDREYTEVRAIEWKDKQFLENSEPLKFYDSIICLRTNLYLVGIGNKYGLITSTKELLPVEYIWIDKLSDYCIYAKSNEGITIYDLEGNLLLDNLEDATDHFNPFGDYNDYIWAKRGGKWGLFDPHMKPIIPFRFEYDKCQILYGTNRDDLYIKVFKDGKCGLINGYLNVELVPLEDHIADINYNFEKEYVITFKADHEELHFSSQDILNIEDKIRNQS